MPPPKGPIMNRAKRGLYAGRHISFGNNISFSYQHTRRSFKPNVRISWILSEVLQKEIRLKVTTHAMRCIRKAGGLDAYLLSSKHVDDSLVGRKLREDIVERLRKYPNIPIPQPFVRKPRDRSEEKALEEEQKAKQRAEAAVKVALEISQGTPTLSKVVANGGESAVEIKRPLPAQAFS